MTNFRWSLVQLSAHLLRPEEREVVLGDLAEAQAGAWESFTGVLGLAVRRQALLWKHWRPWFAGFGISLPGSFLLMGASISVSWSYQRLLCPEMLKAASLTRGAGMLVLLYQLLLLIGWAWTSGFVVGSASRKTLWASTLLCYVPCLRCLSEFRVDSLPRVCLFLFLLPAIWGVHQGLRAERMKFAGAILIALAITLLTATALSNSADHPWWKVPLWNLDWVLSLPAWYLVATARRSREAIPA
jgi:hypothetical protein